jgi:hypothetical protein
MHEGGGTAQSQRSRVARFYKNRWYLLSKHNLIGNVALAKNAILLRLAIERAVLKYGGRFIFSDRAQLADKLLGRTEIIRYCRENYK